MKLSERIGAFKDATATMLQTWSAEVAALEKKVACRCVVADLPVGQIRRMVREAKVTPGPVKQEKERR